MKSKYKILVTDINRKKNLDSNIPLYVDELNSQYNCYATVKMSMNYYTLKEMITEQDNPNSDLDKYFKLLTDLINKHILGEALVDDKAIEVIRQLRGNVEYKMKNLTAFTDGYEIYEYILNRIEAGIKQTTEQVNVDMLASKMFKYVFSENDTVVVNSKLQLLMAQLPVRMTKNKFYDIVTNTLTIYKGGEKSSVDEFADMLRAAILIDTPKGFETEYPFLYHVYKDLCDADYKNMDEAGFDELSERLGQAADIVNNEVSALMLLQEVINDVYTILLTVDNARAVNCTKAGYKSSVKILDACVKSDNLEDMLMGMTDEFMNVEGVQEDVYENIVILEAAFDDIRQNNMEKIESLSLKDSFDKLSTVSKLLSTSLFIDLEKEYTGASNDVADNDYIMALRDKLTGEMTSAFEGKDRRVIRSMMSKILASMPIFMNSQQEIKDYFEYVLENCKDDSELTACYKLISEIMEE